jgi:phosphomevalonate kinase
VKGIFLASNVLELLHGNGLEITQGRLAHQSKTLGTICQMTQFHNSEYVDILQCCCESIKYCAVILCLEFFVFIVYLY